MVEWLVIVISVLMPLVLLPVFLPSLVLMAKRKNVTDAPNFRKMQKRPVPLMGGMLVVSVMATSLACASLYVPLNDLFPAMCMMLLLMSVGLIDDSIELNYNVKLIIQIFVTTILCFVGDYRITSLWTVFGIETLHPVVSCLLSVFVGVAIMNAINFLDGIDGLTAVYGMFIGIVMTIWGWHHNEMSHAIFSIIISASMFAFWIFNGFSEKYKIYLGDSGSLVLGLYVYLSVCKILSHRAPQVHLSNGYQVAFAVAMLAVPMVDFARVIIGRIVKKKSPFHPDRTHLHHILIDVGYTHQTACLIIISLNIIVVSCWGLLAEWRATHTMHLAVIALISIMVVAGPYYLLVFMRNHTPRTYHKYQVRVRRHRLVLSRRHRKVTNFIDQMPTLKL